jgi:hypothetical protein
VPSYRPWCFFIKEKKILGKDGWMDGWPDGWMELEE